MLSPKQRKCIEMLVAGNFTQKEIANTINVSENTICNWKKNEEFMAEYNCLLSKSINLMAAKAFQTETSLLKAKSEMVRLLAAKDILDRGGFKDGKADNVNQADREININICSTKT